MTPTMKGERRLGGLWCSEVLALLTRYLDGDLNDAELSAVKAHVTGCSACATFGGAFHKAIIALRDADADEDDAVDVSDRVLAALD
jgi:anti-sigma factor RsiW